MSKQIRRARSKPTHRDPLGILSPDLVKLLRKLKPQEYEDLRAVAAMPYFSKHIFNKEVHEDKFGVALSDSPRRVVVAGRRSGKTEFVALDILYQLLTKSNQRIVVAAPEKTHVQEIFTRVRNYLYSNRDLELGIRRDVSAPWSEINYSNGSRIRGFALGSRNRRRGGTGAMRGQAADHLYIDEFTYCNKDSITGAILPILQTAPGTRLTMVGTPPPDNEDWDPRMDFGNHARFHWVGRGHGEDARRHYTNETWSREIMGEWDGYTGS